MWTPPLGPCGSPGFGLGSDLGPGLPSTESTHFWAGGACERVAPAGGVSESVLKTADEVGSDGWIMADLGCGMWRTWASELFLFCSSVLLGLCFTFGGVDVPSFRDIFRGSSFFTVPMHR